MASGSLPPSSSKSKSEENPSDAVKSYEFLADTKWWLHPQPKDNTTFWEPSWQTLKIEEYSEVKKLNSIIRDPSQKNPHDDHLLMSENPQKLLSEMESQFNKTEPWWHTVDLDDLAQINKPGERFVPDKGLASLDHVSNFTDSMTRSIGMNESHSPCGVYNLLSTTPEEAENLQELSKAELLEALCHSQTRAREAEEAAQKAYNEKEHMITHFLKQASHLFAYKQWLHILQLETTCLQLRNSKYRLVYTRSPDTVTWVPTKDAKRVRRKAVKLNPGPPRFKIGAILAALKQPPICFPVIWPTPPPRTPLQASTSKNPVVAVCQLLDTLITEIKKMDSIASAVETDVQKTIPSPWEFSCDLEVDYKSEEKAHIVYSALVIDKELQPDKVRRLMSVSDGKLSVHFEATEARFLRASYSAFVDVLTLATKTIEQFGEGMELQLQNL